MEYIIKKGDSLSKIARKFSVDMHQKYFKEGGTAQSKNFDNILKMMECIKKLDFNLY